MFLHFLPIVAKLYQGIAVAFMINLPNVWLALFVGPDHGHNLPWNDEAGAARPADARAPQNLEEREIDRIIGLH